MGSAEADVERVRRRSRTWWSARAAVWRPPPCRRPPRARRPGPSRPPSAPVTPRRGPTPPARCPARRDARRQQSASELHTHTVRVDTLRQSLRQPDGSASVVDAVPVLGDVPLRARGPRLERAVAAALGPWSDALAAGLPHGRRADPRPPGRRRVRRSTCWSPTKAHASEPPELPLPDGCARAGGAAPPR
ncbi:hypothetical protein QJS66_00975 [Kocuria rhizophila]|nr:hypothetical protein QJS66_00975 [Kocuria rhizophila]